MSNYSEISFFEFQERFRTEDDCFQYLTKLRWPDGYFCPKCGHNDAYFMEKRKVFQCKNCRHQTTVTVNTIFHRTHVPLRKWFWAIFLVGTDKRGCSAKRLEKLRGESRNSAGICHDGGYPEYALESSQGFCVESY